jgi:hypothetical protein
MSYSPAFRFTRSTFAQSRGPLSDDQIRAVAPSVFADAAHDSRSARYAYIPTADVLSALRREGFEVFSARQAITRDDSRAGHAKHLLRLRHASQMGALATVGDSVPEILLLNSHDGTSSYRMMGGVFRFVCSNGMVVPDGTCQTVSVPHMGKIADRVTAGAFEILDGLTRVIESRDDMRALPLTTGEQLAFASAAAVLRFEPAEGESAPVTPEQMNRARRGDDTGSDLWTTLNRVQENSIRGGLRGVTRDANGRRQVRRTREVTGIDQDVKLNRALWTLAEEMRKLKATH